MGKVAEHFDPSYYDAEYFDGGKGYHTYADAAHFGDKADELIRLYNPKSVLDFGCAKGYLVKALRDRGVEAYGYDVSEYALAAAPDEVKPYLFDKVLDQNRLPAYGLFDLIVSYDTFEHIPETELDDLRNQLRLLGHRFHFSVGTVNTPDWQHDASHITIKPLEFWQAWMPEATWRESI